VRRAPGKEARVCGIAFAHRVATAPVYHRRLFGAFTPVFIENIEELLIEPAFQSEVLELFAVLLLVCGPGESAPCNAPTRQLILQAKVVFLAQLSPSDPSLMRWSARWMQLPLHQSCRMW
jgi:hypothetical protein